MKRKPYRNDWRPVETEALGRVVNRPEKAKRPGMLGGGSGLLQERGSRLTDEVKRKPGFHA